jgi:hypothetical protein
MIHRLPVTKGVRVLLQEVSGKPIFLARLPRDPEQIPRPPYGILYSLPGGAISGPGFHDPDADATFIYQVTSVGEDETGATWMRDKTAEALIGRNGDGQFLHPLDVGEGYTCMFRRSEGGSPGGEPTGGIVSVAERFAIGVTPN